MNQRRGFRLVSVVCYGNAGNSRCQSSNESFRQIPVVSRRKHNSLGSLGDC